MNPTVKNNSVQRQNIRDNRFPNSQEEFLRMIEELSKRNKGRFTNIASDLSSNVATPVYSARVNPGTIVYGTNVGTGDMLPEPTRRVNEIPTYTSNNQRNEQYDVNGATYENFFNMMGQSGYQSTPYGGYRDQEEVFQVTGLPYGIATLPDGGILYNDGSIKYEDGTVRDAQGGTIDPGAYGIRTNEDGSIQYSDGSVRRTTIHYGEYANQDDINHKYYQDFAGLGGLENFIFGEQRPITQEYGVYNPNRFYTYNQGTDIQTAGYENNLLRLPVDVKVVSVSQWDGLPPESTQTPYGNSILVQLPNGAYLRLSHLAEYQNVNPGDTIDANKVFALTGATGNVTGPHLDVEYYNEQGQISDPANFFLAVQKMSEQSTPLPEPIQSTPIDTTPSPPQKETPIIEQLANTIEELQPTGEYGVGFTELAKGDIEGAKKELASTIEKINPTGKNFDLGISETLQNQPEVGALKRGETISRGRKFAGNIFADIGKAWGLRERGISELISGAHSLIRSVQASEYGTPEEPPQSKQDIIDLALAKAGEGLKKAQNVFGTITRPFFNNLAEIDKRKIGGSPSTTANPDLIAPKNKFQSTQSNIGKVLGATTSSPASNVFASASTLKPVPTPTPKPSSFQQSQSVSRPSQSSQPSSSSQSSRPSSSSQSKPSYSAPAAPRTSYQTPAYSAPQTKVQYQTPAGPIYQTPKPAPAPAPKPAPAKSNNIFTNLVNTIKSWFKK